MLSHKKQPLSGRLEVRVRPEHELEFVRATQKHGGPAKVLRAFVTRYIRRSRKEPAA